MTGRASRSTTIPSLASSWRRRPPTLSAETIGGTWAISPVRWAAATRRASATDTAPMS